MKSIDKVVKALGGNVIPLGKTSGIPYGLAPASEGVTVRFPKAGTREFWEQVDAFRACGIHIGVITETRTGSLVDCSVYESHRAVAEAAGLEVVE